MLYGYIRVSTKTQEHGTSLEDQKRILTQHGCQKLFQDIQSGSTMERTEFEHLLSKITEGDTLIVCKLDRLARNAHDGYTVVKELTDRGITVYPLDMGMVDAKSPIGKAMLQVMLAFAELERNTIVQRMQNGRDYKRKHDPNYREGRPVKFSKAQREHAMLLLNDHSYKEVAEMTGISARTLVRYRKKSEASVSPAYDTMTVC